MTSVLIVGFLSLIIWGFMIATWGFAEGNVKQGKELILKVIIGIILLWASGIILNLINPNFFGTNS